MKKAIRWAKTTFISGIIAGGLSIICGIHGIYDSTHGNIALEYDLPSNLAKFNIGVFCLSFLTIILGFVYIGIFKKLFAYENNKVKEKHYDRLNTVGILLGSLGVIICLIIFICSSVAETFSIG